MAAERRGAMALLLAAALGGCAAGGPGGSGPAADPRIGQAPMNADSKRLARAYFGRPNAKAFAFAPKKGTSWHAWASKSDEEAIGIAVSKCEELTGERCVLFAVDDEIVWRPGAGPGEAASAKPLDRAALGRLRKEAAAGDAEAQYDLGNRYLHGIGVERDTAEAREWLEPAARAGNGLAAYELGLMYERGLGVQRSRATAGRWFGMGAKAGNEPSIAKAKEYGTGA